MLQAVELCKLVNDARAQYARGEIDWWAGAGIAVDALYAIEDGEVEGDTAALRRNIDRMLNGR